MQWLRSWRPLVHSFSFSAPCYKLSSGGYSPRSTSLARGLVHLRKQYNMSSASLDPPAANRGKRWYRGRKPSNRQNATDIASATADPHRASLAARLAVPESNTPVVSSSAPTPAIVPTPTISRPSSPSYKANFSTVRFEDFVKDGQISKQQHQNIPFEFATEVQAKTLGHILAGKDVYAIIIPTSSPTHFVHDQLGPRKNWNRKDACILDPCH